MGEGDKAGEKEIQTPNQTGPGTASEFLRKQAPLWVDLVATAFWIFVPLKLFVFDVDRYVIDLVAPSFEWVLNYRLLFYLGILAIAALLSKILNLWKWVFYVLFFPLVVVFWKLPSYVYFKGSLDIIFLMLWMVSSIVSSAKKIIVVSFVFLLAAALCAGAKDWRTLYFSSALLIIILYYVFVDKILSVMRSERQSKEITTQIELMQLEAVTKINNNDNTTDLALMIVDDRSKSLVAEIESALLTNRLLLIVAKQLRKYKTSSFALLGGAFDTIYLFAFSTLVYFFVYRAIFAADPSSYELTFNKAPFVFLVLSFKSMIFGSVDGLVIKAQFAQATNITQNISAIFILTIFGSILVGALSQRRNEQFDRVIEISEQESFKIEQALAQKYGFRSMTSFLEEIRRLKGSTVSFLLYLTRQLDQ